MLNKYIYLQNIMFVDLCKKYFGPEFESPQLHNMFKGRGNQ